MPPVIRRGGIRAALAAVTGLLVVLPAGLAHAGPQAKASALTVDVDTPKRVALLKKLTIEGTGATPAQPVSVTVTASGRELQKEQLTPAANGTFSMPLVVNACCGYEISASSGGESAGDAFNVALPKKLGKGKVTRFFNRSLQAQGFHTGTKGRRATLGTRLAIKAFRKTNGMGRSQRYRPAVFRKLLQGGGAFKPRYDDGRHVEVDISRQVMSLIQGDTPKHTFHVSSGAGGTPTIRGKYRFNRREAGYNNVRMYFSVYFRGGYAIHGYSGVPNYPASHGCVRNPIPFSRFIYNWVDIGMPIYIYG